MGAFEGSKDTASFLDLPESLSRLEKAKVAVLSVPYEASTTYVQGTKDGPRAIIEASSQVEFFDEELNQETCQIGIATLEPFERFESSPEQAMAQIKKACLDLLDRDKFVVGLGGEHSISVALAKAFAERHPGLWVLQLDAHSDLRQSYQGSRFNHACAMARILEFCSYVGVGIRSGVVGEREGLPEPSRIFYAHEMQKMQDWQDEVISSLGEPVYVTIDLDFFDPAVMPAVGTPEPGGFFWYETVDFLRKVAQSRKIIGFDVVELCPIPGMVAPNFFAAKLIYKFLGQIFRETNS